MRGRGRCRGADTPKRGWQRAVGERPDFRAKVENLAVTDEAGVKGEEESGTEGTSSQTQLRMPGKGQEKPPPGRRLGDL